MLNYTCAKQVTSCQQNKHAMFLMSKNVNVLILNTSHHETSYHTEELYVNYSVSSKQHLEQRKSETTSKNDVDFADEGSAKAFVPHRMSFPRL